MESTEDLSLLKYYKIFKENLGIIILFIYGIGFINNFIYYELLGIPIFNYIGLNDLIFFFLRYVLGIILILLVFQASFYIAYMFIIILIKWLCVIFNKKCRQIFKHSKKHLDYFFTFHIFDKYINGTRLIVLVFLMFLIISSPYKLVLFPTYIIYFLYTLEQISKYKTYKVVFSFSLVILVAFLFLNTISETYTKRFEKDNYEISFYEGDKYITTSKDCSNYNYLGETSTTIFIFDIQEKTTRIFNKENISKLEIKSPHYIDEAIKKIKENFLYNFFKEAYMKKQTNSTKKLQ